MSAHTTVHCSVPCTLAAAHCKTHPTTYSRTVGCIYSNITPNSKQCSKALAHVQVHSRTTAAPLSCQCTCVCCCSGSTSLTRCSACSNASARSFGAGSARIMVSLGSTCEEHRHANQALPSVFVTTAAAYWQQHRCGLDVPTACMVFCIVIALRLNVQSESQTCRWSLIND